MPRAKNAVASRARRKKVLSQTRGNFGARKNVWTVAKNTYEKGLTYAYRDRKNQNLERCGFRELTPRLEWKVCLTLSLWA